MDFDLEIINEESDRPDPLFDSIMNAMNSMKEATADKIYKKIQKEGATNYSKPQVDRALASALKYGIFEVRNNRYRVRDDVLDDEDTVYWKFQKKRDQTPFRIQEDMGNTPKLDPERDNQRFRKPSKSDECTHCGRAKKPDAEAAKKKGGKVRKQSQKVSKNPKKGKEKGCDHTQSEKRKLDNKRKEGNDKSEERHSKRRKTVKSTNSEHSCYDEMEDELGGEKVLSQEGKSDSSDSDSDLEVLITAESNLKNYNEKNKPNFRKRNIPLQSGFSSEYVKADINDLDAVQSRRSSISVKSESESDKSYASSASDEQSPMRDTGDGFFEERPCTSRNASGKSRNQYLHSSEMYRNQYERGQTDQNKRSPDWLGCSDEPQGTIIQSNNVLTIEPMDSLAFKNPEQASYIS